MVKKIFSFLILFVIITLNATLTNAANLNNTSVNNKETLIIKDRG
jgi:hypothetical protein